MLEPQLTPYEVLYGFSPSIHVRYFPKDSTVELIDDLLTGREEIIKQVKCNLRTAQHRMTPIANNKQSEMSFSIRDYGYLKLQHYKQQAVVCKALHKLSAKFSSLYLVFSVFTW
jgi:hypothetical protein